MTVESTLVDRLFPAFTGLTLVGVVTGVAKGFGWFDKTLSKEGRRRLTLWLKNVPGDEQVNTWANVFPDLIDRAFGKRAFSFKFFLRSCIASVAAVAIVEALMLALFGKKSIVTSDSWEGYKILAYLLGLALPINCVPDYFSLLFSRFIVRHMARRPNPIRVGFLLIIDSAVSLVIALAAICLIAPYLHIFGMLGVVDVYANSIHEAVSMFLTTTLEYAHLLLETSGWGSVVRLYLLASLFTSIWVWLYVLASVTIRGLHVTFSAWKKVIPFLDLDKKPMQAIGRVAGLIAGVGYLAIVAGIWIARHHW